MASSSTAPDKEKTRRRIVNLLKTEGALDSMTLGARLGVPAMAVSFFALMALLSIAKLSFAVPATASSYVLETALAKYILREHIGWRRWAGASLVGCGVLLVAI